jgi:two-component SAPR family response regulator
VPASSGGTISPTVSGTASPAAGADHGYETPSAGPVDGVDVPGGWITLGLGAGLVAAVAMVWRRRRHRYQPTPITSPHLDDPDLLPPLAAMTRLRTSLRRTAPETLDEQPTAAPTVREYRAADVKPALPPVGPSGSDLAGAAKLPLSTGLGLTGDGALGAARGLLVATLASGSDDDPDAKGRAIIAAATLATLLGAGAAVDLGHLDRLTVTASHADAITGLEEEIIRRSRLITDAQTADVQTLRDNDFHAEPLPQVLLIAEVPDPAWTTRLVTAVRLGHSVDIGAALLGDWPTGTTLTVASDGTTGNDDTPRLAVLDTAAAIEMLDMLREAHGDIDSPARPEPPERPHQPAPAPAEPDVVEPDTGPVDDIAMPATATSATASRLPVAVRVLGRPAVLDHDGQSSPGIRSKAIELLVYLAVNRHGADLSDIMEALYPDANLRRAGERLSTVVADLRKHIRQAAAAPADTEQPRKQRLEPIPNTGSRYHLDPRIVRVDWWTVLDHYEATATATATGDEQLSHLTAAIEAAGGALAEGVEYDWIDTDREVVRRHRIKLLAHAAALLADTDPHRSWLLLEQACQLDPLSDELARTTMHAAAALGDADAIRHRLKTLRDALDAHGLELSDETESLAKELLRHLRPPPQR